MKNKIVLAGLLLLLTIGIGFGLYWVFFRAPIAPVPPEELAAPLPLPGLPTVAPGAPLPTVAPPPSAIPVPTTIAQGGPTQTQLLSETIVKAARLAADGQSLTYYNPDDSRFYQRRPDGQATQLSDRQFFNVQKINWAPGSRRAILEYPDGANILFDFDRQEQVTIPKHWEGFNFSPNGEQIVAKSLGIDPNNRWLIMAKADGSEARAVEALGENADKVISAWSPNDQVIAFSDTGRSLGFDRSEIYLVGKNKENFKSLTVEGRDFRPLWTPDGKKILYSVWNVENNYNPALWIVGGQGDQIGSGRRSIGLQTWADKCVFADAQTAFCAVPRSLPEGYGLVPALARDVPDLVYRLDVLTGIKTLIGSPSEETSMEELSVSADGRFLYFIDSRTGQLKQMQLR